MNEILIAIYTYKILMESAILSWTDGCINHTEKQILERTIEVNNQRSVNY